MTTATFNAYLFNPVFWHIWDALHNPKIRKILVRGGSSAGKTAAICDACNLYTLETRPSEMDPDKVLLNNIFALRKHRVHVETTIKASFEASIDRLEGLSPYFKKMEGEIRVETGAEIKYAGLDDPEKVKGLEGFRIIYINELNQFESIESDELDRRLRGIPGQKLVADWNPIIKTHWINSDILSESEGWEDLELSLPQYERNFGAFTALTSDAKEGNAFKRINAAGDTIWINTTYRDNFWIVGHPGNNVKIEGADPVAADGRRYGFIDTHTLANFEKMKIRKPNDYRIYGLGEDGLMRTGGELWAQFDENTHTRDMDPDLDSLIWISADKNVVPYITLLIWQAIETEDGIKELRQISEVMARPPDNTALKAALLLDKYLQRVKYRGAIAVAGDPSAKARSTEDDKGRSFFDKLISTLERLGWKVINRVQKSPPEVLLSQDFINDIYQGLITGWRIVIGSTCRTSLEDYNLFKQGPDGKGVKELVKDPVTLQRYQKYGHASDAKRYLVTTILSDIFTTYKKSSKPARIMAVKDNLKN